MKKQVFFLLLLAAMLAPRATQAQGNTETTFRTGVDAERWIALSEAATMPAILENTTDDGTTDVMNIGFVFSLADERFTQFSLSTNGRLRLGSEPVSNSYSSMFATTAEYPVIGAYSRDSRTLQTPECYVKYETVGTAPHRILVVQYKQTANYNTMDSLLYQIQLHEDSGKIVLVYGNNYCSSLYDYQAGIGYGSHDLLAINTATHTAAATATPYETYNTTWPGNGRYYEMVPPQENCLRPIVANIQATTTGTTLTWSGQADRFTLEYAPFAFTPGSGEGTVLSTTDTSLTLSSLASATTYHYTLRAHCGDESSSYLFGTFTTACVPVAYPLVYGCEEHDNFVSCWYLGSDDRDAVPSYNDNVRHNGSRSLHLPHAFSEGVHYWVALPEIADAALSDLMISFYLSGGELAPVARSSCSTYTNSPATLLQVGYMTHVADPTTFVPVAPIHNNGHPWSRHFVLFPDSIHYPAGARIAFMSAHDYNTIASNLYLDDIAVEQPLSCPLARDIQLTAHSASMASLRWQYHTTSSETPPTGYEVAYAPLDNLSHRQTVTLPGTGTILTNLTNDTEYQIWVTPLCGNQRGGTDSLRFRTTTLPCTEYHPTLRDTTLAGTGTAASTAVLFPDVWYHRYQQMLYSAEELEGGKHITHLAFQRAPGDTATIDNVTHMEIYLAHVPDTMLGDSFIPYHANTFQQVYSGAATVRGNDWWELALATPFAYNGIDNLLMVITSSVEAYYPYKNFLYSHVENGMLTLQSDDAPFSATATPSTAYAADMRVNTRFIGNACANYDYCAAPTVTVDSVSHAEAYISWLAGYQETAWNLCYREAGTTEWTIAQRNLTERMAVVAGLQGGTTYEIGVVAHCDDSLTGTATLTTECSPISHFRLPYHADFSEAYTGYENLPPCWNYAPGASTDNPMLRIFYDDVTPVLEFYSDLNTPNFVVLPAVDVDIRNVELTTKLYKYGDVPYAGALIVGVMRDRNDASTFVAVDTVMAESADSWNTVTVDFDNYRGNGHYIALRSDYALSHALSNLDYDYLFLSDLSVRTAAPCPLVHHPRVAAYSATTAHLTWHSTRPESNYGYELRYAPVNNPALSHTIIHNDIRINLTGLTPNTEYIVWVSALCGDSYGGGDSVVFRTANSNSAPCMAPVVALDSIGNTTAHICWLSDNANQTWDVFYRVYGDTAWMVAQLGSTLQEYTLRNLQANTRYQVKVMCLCPDSLSSTTTFTTRCHSIASEELPYAPNWAASSGTLPDCWLHVPGSSSSYPYINSGTYDNRQHYLYFYTAGNNNCFVTLPAIDEEINKLEMSVDCAYRSGYGLSEVIVGVMTDPTAAATFVPVDTLFATFYRWENRMVSFKHYTGNGHYIAFRTDYSFSSALHSNNPSYLLLSNLEVRYRNCYIPSNLSVVPGTNDATFSWDNGLDESAWNLHVWSNAIDTTYLVTTHPVTLYGLAQGTAYHVAVQAVCDSTSLPNRYSDTIAFTTECNEAAYPFFHGFETSDSLLACWHFGSNGTAQAPSHSTSHHTGERGLLFSACSTWAVMPHIATASLSDVQLSLYAQKALYENPVFSPITVLQAGYMTDEDDPSTFVHIKDIVASPDEWWHCYISFPDTISYPAGARIAFMSDPARAQLNPFAIDDVALLPAFPCPVLDDIYINPGRLTTSTAQLSWWIDNSSSLHSPTAYEIAYAPLTNLSHVQIQTVTTRNATLTGLSANTEYRVWITPLCDSNYGYTDSTTFTTTNCDSVTTVSVTATDSSAAVSWSTDNYNPERFEVEYGPHGFAHGSGTTLTTTATTLTLYGLTPHTRYDVYVRVLCDSLHHSAWSHATTFSTTATPCPTPFNLAATVLLHVATFTWSSDAENSTWHLHVWNEEFDTTYSVATTPVTVSQLMSGTTYYAAVQGRCDSNRISPYSDTITFTTDVCPVVTAVTVDSATLTDHSAVVSWSAAAYHNGTYEVEYGEQGFERGSGITLTTTDTVVTLTWLYETTTFEVYVRGLCNESGPSAWSAAVSFTTPARPCRVPTLLTANPDLDHVALSWNFGNDEAAWEIHLWNDYHDQYYDTYTMPNTIFGLGAGETYHAAVRAYCNGTIPHSSYSDTITFTTDSCMAVSQIHITDITQTTATVAWTPGGNNDSIFEVYYGEQGNYEEAWNTLTTTTPQIALTALEQGTAYEVHVRANCRGLFLSTTGVTYFTTDCGPIYRNQLPYRADFEYRAYHPDMVDENQDLLYQLPACWKRVPGSSTHYPYIEEHSNGRDNVLRFETNREQQNFVALPEIEMAADSLEMVIDLYRHFDKSGLLIVGVMEDPLDGNTFVATDTLIVPRTNTWTTMAVNFRHYHGNGHYIALRTDGALSDSLCGSSDDWLLLSNPEVRPYTMCCPTVIAYADNLTHTSAGIHVIDATQNNAYSVAYSTSNDRSTAHDSLLFHHSTTLLTGLAPNTTYYAWIRPLCNDDRTHCPAHPFSFTTLPACMGVSNLACQVSIPTGSALLSWEAPIAGAPATEYIVRYKRHDDNAWQTDTTTLLYYRIEHLVHNTDYNYSVATRCPDGGGNEQGGSFSFYNANDDCTSLSDGGYSNGDLLINGDYHYGLHQSIYLAEEFSDMGDTIHGVFFRTKNYTVNATYQIHFYIGHTDMDALGSNWLSTDSLTLVCTAYHWHLETDRWNYLPFDTPFVRDTARNIVIAMCNITGNQPGNGRPVWDVCSRPGNNVRSLYRFGNSSNLFATTPNTSNLVPGIHFDAACMRPDCTAPQLACTDKGDDFLALHWIAGNNESRWAIDYRAADDTAWISLHSSTTATRDTLTNLRAGTHYEVRIRALCHEDLHSDWNHRTFLTEGCATVENIAVQATATTATATWSCGNNSGFEVEYGTSGFAIGSGIRFTTATPAATLTGLAEATDYDLYVRTLCNGEHHSPWNTITFSTLNSTTDTCHSVTLPVADSVGDHTASLSWQPGDNNSSIFMVEYGLQGFAHGDGTMLEVSTPSCLLTGLESNTAYDAYIRALCEDFTQSEWSERVSFNTTNTGIAITDTENIVTLYPNPAEQSTTLSLNGMEGTVEATLVDMNGRIAAQLTLECHGNCQQEIVLHNLPAGAYYLRLQGNTIHIVKKLIVK